MGFQKLIPAVVGHNPRRREPGKTCLNSHFCQKLCRLWRWGLLLLCFHFCVCMGGGGGGGVWFRCNVCDNECVVWLLTGGHCDDGGTPSQSQWLCRSAHAVSVLFSIGILWFSLSLSLSLLASLCMFSKSFTTLKKFKIDEAKVSLCLSSSVCPHLSVIICLSSVCPHLSVCCECTLLALHSLIQPLSLNGFFLFFKVTYDWKSLR